MSRPGPDGEPAIPERPAEPRRLGGGFGYEAFVRRGAVGHGGNATVYEASLRDDPDRVVALKEPHVADPVPAEVRERFRTEAETWAALDDHAHVVTVHAEGTDPHPWIALEYMDAGTLADQADDCRLERGVWTGACVAAALEHAHRNGVVHLDMKPENVLFREAPGDAWPIPKVADWGTARNLRPGTVNLEGLSPRYAAPEQFDPERYGRPGPATDVYQLGVVLYELLVGTVPFDGPPQVLREAVLDEPPPVPSGRNPDLPASVDDLLDRALAKEPAARYGSMAGFRRELERLFAARTGFDAEEGAGTVLVDEGTDAPPDTPPGQVAVAEGAGSPATSPYDRALTLASEGFVQLSDRYFARREPAPPLAAWRRGVRLVDAHAGRAVERSIPADDGEAERVSLTDRLLDGLGEGADHVVLGAPGSGKSTVCKQVACEWFERGRGPVFYRESGTGTRFDRPDALARRVTAADGHALVVVEDAVRPGAAAVFEFLDRVGDRADVTLLLDAREGEWRDAGRGSDSFGADPVTEGREALEPVYVPRPDRREHERFVRVAEAAADRSLDVDVERLRGGVRRAAAGESGGEETQPGELFYLLHRLTALARDPLAADDATTLTDTVRDVADRLADAGDAALDVGVCANVCNAAGVGVHPELLYAVAAGDPLAVDDALDVLDGRVVFPRAADWSDGTTAYPAIHEAWSTEFLAQWLDDADGEAARERFGRVVTRLLGLADDERARERVAGALQGTATYVARVERDPGGWVDETVEAVFGLAEAYPRLAPLFGTTETAAYELPESCPPGRRRDVILTRGDAHRGASDYDRARSEYETARRRAQAAGDRRRVAAGLDGLGTVARLVNDFDEAREHYRESLAIAREIGDRRLEAEVLNHLGMNATRRDAYDRAREHVERSLDVARDLDDRLAVARCLHTLGTIATRQGDPERARERLEPSLEIKRDLGDRPGVARSLNRLGTAAQKRGEHERARDYFERSLEIWRELGNRWWVAALLHNVGMVETVQGNYDRARECHRRALEINRELDVPHGVAMNYSKLGMVAEERDEYETAREHHRRSVEIFRDLGKPQDLAYAFQYLGTTARGLGELDAAREHLDRSLETHREVGDDHGRAECLRELGRLERRRENRDEARTFYEDAAELFGDIGDVRQELAVLEKLIELELDAGRDDRARAHCETAGRRLDDATVPDDRRDAIESLCDEVAREPET